GERGREKGAGGNYSILLLWNRAENGSESPTSPPVVLVPFGIERNKWGRIPFLFYLPCSLLPCLFLVQYLNSLGNHHAVTT
ncbi:hypothetical protein, partial [Nostoc sp. UIC 10630]|uniref:hypothetical protein n=1 Tax=Nostoc sp. UIC 10630 TaxID=2100146 RepID=UPI001A9C79A3